MMGISYGAATVLNAVLCGKGSAFGVGLETKAEFTLAGEKDIHIVNDSSENTAMARICVENTLKHIGMEEPTEWSLSIDSDIPISRGMKSSSSACNAIILSVLDQMSCELDDNDIVKLSVECARASGVTVTGALDDASACHFGGILRTDNMKDEIVSKTDVPDVDVLFCVPDEKIRKYIPDIPSEVRKRAEELFFEIPDDPWNVLTENGRLVSQILGIDNSIADIAMENGALAAGITGFGPATVIVLHKDDKKRFIEESNISPNIITGSRRLSF